MIEAEMKEKLLLVGAGSFGRVVLEHAIKEYNCAFLDDGIAVGTLVNGVPVIGTLSDIGSLFDEFRKLLVVIGNNELRERVYAEAEGLGYEFPDIIVSSAYISPYAKIGSGCIILNNTVVQNGAVLGNGVILNAGVEAHQDCGIGSNVLVYANTVIRSGTHIGDRAWIGCNVSIGTGVTVPEDARIEDGTVVKL